MLINFFTKKIDINSKNVFTKKIDINSRNVQQMTIKL